MKVLTPLAVSLYTLAASFPSWAEEAEQPMEHSGPFAIILFFGIVVAACVWFFIAMNKPNREKTDIKMGKED